jgi:hypothetical protein
VLMDLSGLSDDGVSMSDLHGMLERVIAGCKGIDSFLLCHKASSTGAEPSMKQAALGTWEPGNQRHGRLWSVYLALHTSEHGECKAGGQTCQSLWMSFVTSWEVSDSTMNYVCTSSNAEGKPNLDALLKFNDSLMSDSRKAVSVPDPAVTAKVVLLDVGTDGAELETTLKLETDKLRGEMDALKRAYELANERTNALQQATNGQSSGPIGKMLSGAGDFIDDAGGVVLGGGPLVSTVTKLF